VRVVALRRGAKIGVDCNNADNHKGLAPLVIMVVP